MKSISYTVYNILYVAKIPPNKTYPWQFILYIELEDQVLNFIGTPNAIVLAVFGNQERPDIYLFVWIHK